jgi:hypothetical protein
LLYTLTDETSYAQAIDALDLSEQMALRAVALSAVNRADIPRIAALRDAQTLPAEHQSRVIEALAAASEDIVRQALSLLTAVIDWIDDKVATKRCSDSAYKLASLSTMPC